MCFLSGFLCARASSSSASTERGLFGIDLGEQVKDLRENPAFGIAPLEYQLGVLVIAAAQIGLTEVEEDFGYVRLERIGPFKFRLSSVVLFFGGEQNPESRVKLKVTRILSGKIGG